MISSSVSRGSFGTMLLMVMASCGTRKVMRAKITPMITTSTITG
jgi:hypothetical protein